MVEKAEDVEDISALSPKDLIKLVHEIERDMQSKELRQAQLKLEELSCRYQDL